MQYTLRGIPRNLDRALREHARQARKSLNETAVEAMKRAMGLVGEPLQERDLSDVAGTWISDPETERALAEQRSIDAE